MRPRALGIKIAWFIMEWQLVFECMVAEQLSWCLEEGTNHLNTAAQVPTIAHAPEALGSALEPTPTGWIPLGHRRGDPAAHGEVSVRSRR